MRNDHLRDSCEINLCSRPANQDALTFSEAESASGLLLVWEDLIAVEHTRHEADSMQTYPHHCCDESLMRKLVDLLVVSESERRDHTRKGSPQVVAIIYVHVTYLFVPSCLPFICP